ncbi:molybdopterin oxidoreductase family protein [Clostridium sp.]|jgi:assimilatory nitrate reductase catalytic subunit|uniref:molybdopterin oxidoreductase family protein n=1 Tax=Clostridium sp. TaxID=1506 RepID=UPI002587F4E1|nr:molybdopterin oxidoreductase family protein [Clostridium sp.]MDF2504272.1 Nitrate reductase [Clostridium sp.]
MNIKQSTCNYCSLACNLDFYVENNEIIKILPTKSYPVNENFCCIKGLSLQKQCSKYKSSEFPLLKNLEGKREEVSWDKAFNVFSDRMKYIKKEYGKESVAYISTGQITTEEMALLGFVGRIHMGINGDGNTRLCMASSVVAYKQSFGFDSPPYTLRDLEISDTVIFIGANPVVAHPVAWSRLRKNQSAKIIVVDPRKSETAAKAHIWIDIKPKADIILLYTLANILIDKQWIDRKYIENYTVDFDGFKNHVKKYTLDNAEELTGISKKRILELAEIIHRGKRVSFWWTMGVNQGYQAVRTAQAIINIAVMTGNIGREGTGPNSLTGQCNAMGSRLYSNTTALYGGRDFDNPLHRKQVADILELSEENIPSKPTIPYSEIINRINSGKIKALWVVATNPRHSWTNNREFENAVKKLEFFVVQDLYDDTDSAKLCDLFLPSVPATKKQGFLINTERRLSSVVPVISRETDELSDYDIFLGIGKALGMGKILDKWKTPRHAFEIIKKFSEGMPCDITGVNYEKLVNSKGIQWPFRSGDKLQENERRLFENNEYFTKDKKMKFMYEEVMKNPIVVNREFPYILNTGRITVGQWHTQTRTREINLEKNINLDEAYIIINPELAEELCIKEREKVIVSSINGNKNKFAVKISGNIKKRHIYAPIHYIETNSLTLYVFDTYSKEPSYKYVSVNIQKI